MKRGQLYRVRHPKGDPKRFRVFVVVSRQGLIDSRFSCVICAPVYSNGEGLGTQVELGINEGLKHHSSIHCDELISLAKVALTDFVSTLPLTKMRALDAALMVALGIERSSEGDMPTPARR